MCKNEVTDEKRKDRIFWPCLKQSNAFIIPNKKLESLSIKKGKI